MKKIQIGPPLNKIPIRVRIFKCSQPYYWYSDIKIYKNKQYEVLAYEEGKGYTVKRFKHRQRYFIDINDADVVKYVDKTENENNNKENKNRNINNDIVKTD